MNPGAGTFAAVILAGGASSRMGAPKALLRYRGETFLDRLVRLFGEHCAPVVAVVGHSADLVVRGLARPDAALLVVNPRPERGQFSSLQAGLRGTGGAADAVFFHPVDTPAIEARTIGQLCAAWAGAPAGTLVLKPRWHGRTGHPVLIAAALAREWLALPAESSAREVLRGHAAATLTVDVDDAGIVRDADTPEDYEQLIAGAPPA